MPIEDRSAILEVASPSAKLIWYDKELRLRKHKLTGEN